MACFRWGWAQTRPPGGCPLHIIAQRGAQESVLQLLRDWLGVIGVPGVAQLLEKCLDLVIPGTWVGSEAVRP